MRALFEKVRSLLAGLTLASMLFLLPVLEFLEANPFFGFRYGFDQTLLFVILLLFGALPAAIFAFLLADRNGAVWVHRLTLGLALAVFLSQLQSTALGSASPLLHYGIPVAGFVGGILLLRKRAQDLIGVLALTSLVACLYASYQVGEQWWRIPKQPSEPRVEPSALTGRSDIYLFFLDGCTLTSDHLDTEHFPVHDALPNLHRFVREDTDWFYNAVSNGPATTTSAPSIFTGKLYASRANNLLANEETIFTILRSRFEVRAYLHTKGHFCVGENFELCYPFKQKTHIEPLRILLSSFAFISSFRLTPLGYPIGEFDSSGYSRSEFVDDFLERVDGPSEKPRFYTLQLFDRGLDGLQEFDRLLGRFISILERRGRYDDSIIAVMSDHGLNRDGERFIYGPSAEQKRRLYRVPFAVKPPGRGRGAIHDYVAQGIDIMPTLLALVLPEAEYHARSYDGVNVLKSRPEREHYINMLVPGKLYKLDGRSGSGLVAVPLREVEL